MIPASELRARILAFLTGFQLRSLRDLVAISLIALPTFLRVGLGGGQIRPSDSDFPLYPTDYLYQLSFAWFQKGWLFGNNGAYTNLAQQPFYFLPVLLQLAGLSPNVVNLGTLFLLLSLLGYSAYFMALSLLPNRNRLASVVCAAFYMYNPYIIGEVYLGHWFNFYAYASLPWLVLAVVKGLRTDSRWKAWAVVVAMVSVFIVQRPRLVPIVLEFVGIYLVLHLLFDRSWQTARRTAKFVLLSGVATVLVNSWWILPTLATTSTVYALLTRLTIENPVSLAIDPTFLDPLNVFRLVGSGIPRWQASGSFYEQGAGAVTGLAIALLAYGATLLRRRHVAGLYFALAAASFTIPMLLLRNSSIFLNAYNYLQSETRSPFNLLFFPYSFEFWSVPIALSYAYLLAVTADALEERLAVFLSNRRERNRSLLRQSIRKINYVQRLSRGRGRQAVSILLIVLVLLNSLPLIAGVEGDFVSPVRVPAYYQDARIWLQGQAQDFVILAVPRSQTLQFVRYDWAYDGRYFVTDILPQVSPVPVISASVAPGSREGIEIVDLTYDSLGKLPIKDLLSLMSVKYIVHRNDVVSAESSSGMVSWPPDGLFLVKTIGQLDFYDNPSYVPMVSATNQILPVWGGTRALLPLLYYDNLSIASSAIVFSGDVSKNDFIQLLNGSPLLVSFDQPLNDSFIASQILSQGINVAYLLDNTTNAFIKVLRDGYYHEKDVLWSGKTLDSLVTLSKDSVVSLWHHRTALSNDSFTVLGSSIASDFVSFQNTSTNGWEIQWQADSRVAGFHALYLGLNQSAWNLSSLASQRGGLRLRVYGDGSGRELRFSFMAPAGNRFYWPVQSLYLDWVGWRELFLPITNFQEVGSPSWSDVTQLWLWQEVPSQGATHTQIQIDGFGTEISPRFSIFEPLASVGPTGPTSFDKTVDLRWTKESPSHYTADAMSATPFVLRLNVAYDPGWEATSNGIKLTHFRVDSYSNGFLVPATQSSTQIDIAYKSQKLAYYGAYISLTSFFVLALLTLRWSIRPLKTTKMVRRVREEHIEEPKASLQPVSRVHAEIAKTPPNQSASSHCK